MCPTGRRPQSAEPLPCSMLHWGSTVCCTDSCWAAPAHTTSMHEIYFSSVCHSAHSHLCTLHACSSYVPAPVTFLHKVDARVKQLWLVALYLIIARATPQLRLAIAGSIALISIIVLPPRLWKSQVRLQGSAPAVKRAVGDKGHHPGAVPSRPDAPAACCLLQLLPLLRCACSWRG